jgi:hypothetical protein
MSEKLKETVEQRILINKDEDFKLPEEYFYALAQIIVYVFERLGGADNHRKEFSYLTCPNVPCDAIRLNNRATHFLENVPKILEINDDNVNRTFRMIFSWNKNGRNSNINLRMCEEAFYDGIYEENIFLK